MTISKSAIYELKKSPSKGMVDEVFQTILHLSVEDRGELPRTSRAPGKGRKGELWFRNSLFALGTIPLEHGESLILTHVEAAVYPRGEPKVSADLVGLWHSKDSTKFCVAELKAGRDGDNVIYALAEGFRNLWLHKSEKGLKRLREGWKDDKSKGQVVLNAWGAGNPFMGDGGRLHKSCLIVIGDATWITEQSQYKSMTRYATDMIESRFKIPTKIYSLNKKAKANSKPYMLLPLNRWL